MYLYKEIDLKETMMRNLRSSSCNYKHKHVNMLYIKHFHIYIYMCVREHINVMVLYIIGNALINLEISNRNLIFLSSADRQNPGNFCSMLGSNKMVEFINHKNKSMYTIKTESIHLMNLECTIDSCHSSVISLP